MVCGNSVMSENAVTLNCTNQRPFKLIEVVIYSDQQGGLFRRNNQNNKIKLNPPYNEENLEDKISFTMKKDGTIVSVIPNGKTYAVECFDKKSIAKYIGLIGTFNVRPKK